MRLPRGAGASGLQRPRALEPRVGSERGICSEPLFDEVLFPGQSPAVELV